jgi:hypothetical protein
MNNMPATATKKPRAKKAASSDFAPDALALRTADKNGRAYGGFQWPTVAGAMVECPDWKPAAQCGNGLHGYIDGLGSRDQLSNDANALWYVVEVVRSECVLIDGDKSKFPRCRVKYVGSFGGALAMFPLKMVEGIFAQSKSSKSAAATTGDGSAAATTGYGSAAATTGYGSAAATTGYGSAAATTGNRSAAATTGNRSAAATTGENSIAAALGPNSTARAEQKTGAIVLSEWDNSWNLIAVAAFKVGESGIEAGKTYRLVGGKPVAVSA